MRWPKITFLLLPLIIASATAEWSWGAEAAEKPTAVEAEKSTELLQGESLPEAEEKSLDTNVSIDDIVAELQNKKQGRSLSDFDDDVYSDPTIKEALDAGDDAEARNLIKGRLCNLGLIQCEDEDDTQEKRFLSPDELIYAQPVDIKPIGKPVASIAVRGPPRAYGPPKPMHYPPRPQKGPPKRYGPNPRPGFSEKYGVAGSNFQFSQGSNSFSGGYEGNFVTKPPTFSNEGPYAYENSKPSYNKSPSSSHSGIKTEVVQQHVHHHYVHDDTNKDPKVIIKPVAIPVGSIGHLASQNHGQHSSDIITASGGDFSSISSGGFKPMTGSLPGPVYEPDTVYGSQYGHNSFNKGSSSGLTQSLPNRYPSGFEEQKFGGNSIGAYSEQNSEFYKKELHVGSGNNNLYNPGYNQGSSGSSGIYNQQGISGSSGIYNKQGLSGASGIYNQGLSGSSGIYNQGSSGSLSQGASNNLYNQGPATFGQSNSYEENYHVGKAQGFECACVNYDQCPSQEIIGRRDDLYLPIDPRNKGSEITALTEEQLDNLNKTETSITENKNSTETETKKVSKREIEAEQEPEATKEAEPRQYNNRPSVQQCRPNQVCCRRPLTPQATNRGQCGLRHSQGINGRIKTPEYVDGDSEFGEYPWQVAILKKDPKEAVYVCGGTLIDGLHIMTAAHCIKSHKGFDLRVRLGEWDVNRDVEFFPYVERDIVSIHVHPQYYAGTLDNDLAILKMDRPVDWTKTPHISPACLPDKYTEYAGQRCWTTGWGKDAFGQGGKYQNILKEVDVPVFGHGQCQQQLRQTRLGYNYELNPGFLCAGGEEGKDACKGDGGGPLVCERGGTWQLVGVVSWGIGCGEVGVPGVYVKVAHYLDWIAQITGKFSPY